MERLCRELRVTRQHLARLFERDVGVAPKVVARVARVRHVMTLAGRQPAWARIAAEAGYADQSHLIADFRTVVGATPAAWLARRQVPNLL
jgi:AraC-like DNA-binding protein